MSSATRRIIEWDGEHEADMVRELRELPPGRYVLVPANELSDDDEPEDLELTPEQIRGLDEALGRFERGETGVPLEEARARIRARLEAAAQRR